MLRSHLKRYFSCHLCRSTPCIAHSSSIRHISGLLLYLWVQTVSPTRTSSRPLTFDLCIVNMTTPRGSCWDRRLGWDRWLRWRVARQWGRGEGRCLEGTLPWAGRRWRPLWKSWNKLKWDLHSVVWDSFCDCLPCAWIRGHLISLRFI